MLKKLVRKNKTKISPEEFKRTYYTPEQTMKKLGVLYSTQARLFVEKAGIETAPDPERFRKSGTHMGQLDHILRRGNVYTGRYHKKPAHYRALLTEFSRIENNAENSKIMEEAIEFEKDHLQVVDAAKFVGMTTVSVRNNLTPKEHPFESVTAGFYNLRELEEFRRDLKEKPYYRRRIEKEPKKNQPRAARPQEKKIVGARKIPTESAEKYVKPQPAAKPAKLNLDALKIKPDRTYATIDFVWICERAGVDPDRFDNALEKVKRTIAGRVKGSVILEILKSLAK